MYFVNICSLLLLKASLAVSFNHVLFISVPMRNVHYFIFLSFFRESSFVYFLSTILAHYLNIFL